jgi:GTP-binding protein EngB required for normal cell division
MEFTPTAVAASALQLMTPDHAGQGVCVNRDISQAHWNQEGSAPPLNEAQRLNLRVSCEYMDKMLQQIEAVLASPDSRSPFTRYIADLGAAKRRVVEDYIRRLRSQILRALAWQGLEPAPPEIPATRSIRTHLHFIQIALADLRPGALRGSGPIAEATAKELAGIVSELSSIVAQMMNYVDESKEDLRERIQKLTGSGEAAERLKKIEAAVASQGLVEFRPRIDSLLARLENPVLEVAVFGRVSAGKSSFLNALLETDLLPVGTNPITAVPTRVQYGKGISAYVRFGNGPETAVPVEQLRELITESGNPGNMKGVREALFALPATRLAEGIVLVDTPGLGSLALRGAQETLAYLPSCDLALMLIDAGSTLTPEDTGTLRLLKESGITTQLLLSKADLLNEAERVESLRYIRAQVREQLGVDLPIHPVSRVGEHTKLITDLYRETLEPTFRESRELQLGSINRKLVNLQADVVVTLQNRMRAAQNNSPQDAETARSLERQLTSAASQLAVAERRAEDAILALGFGSGALIKELAAEQAIATNKVSVADLARALESSVHREVGAILHALQSDAAEATGKVLTVGQQLQRSNLPDASEISNLIRNAPRFAMPERQGEISLGGWTLLGSEGARRRLLSALRTSVEPVLEQELRAYSAALGRWAKETSRDLRFILESFAEGYRTSLQQAQSPGDDIIQFAETRNAIASLL